MKWTVSLAAILLTSLFADSLGAQSTFSFRNRPVYAPVFDAEGLPLAGTNYQTD